MEDIANFVKRSEMDFNCKRGGSIICTSGSRQRGSWIEATAAAARTWTGMDCVMVVSRSWEWKPAWLCSDNELSGFVSDGKEAFSVVIGGPRDESVLVMIVRERRGILSFLVRRIEAEEPPRAERSARESRVRGTWRLMVFPGVADWMV